MLHSHGKIHPFLRTVNHLFLRTIYTMAMLVITSVFFYPHELCWCHCYPTVAVTNSFYFQTDHRKRMRRKNAKKEPVLWVITCYQMYSNIIHFFSITRPCHSLPHGFPVPATFFKRNAVVMRRAEETQSFGLGWLSERLC